MMLQMKKIAYKAQMSILEILKKTEVQSLVMTLAKIHEKKVNEAMKVTGQLVDYQAGCRPDEFISVYGSKYRIIAYFQGNLCIAMRKKNEHDYVVRIQGSLPKLHEVAGYLVFAERWGEVKDADHLSVVVQTKDSLVNALTDAFRACILAATMKNERF